MSQLRTELESAKADYHRLRYDGDLAAELLPRPAPHRWWALPLATAVAAMVLIAVRHRMPSAPGPAIVVNLPPSASVAKRPARSPLLAIADIHYENYVRDVDTNMRDTVRVLTGSVDRALTAPVVTDGFRKVDEVTDDLKHIATQTWSQLLTAPNRPAEKRNAEKRSGIEIPGEIRGVA